MPKNAVIKNQNVRSSGFIDFYFKKSLASNLLVLKRKSA